MTTPHVIRLTSAPANRPAASRARRRLRRQAGVVALLLALGAVLSLASSPGAGAAAIGCGPGAAATGDASWFAPRISWHLVDPESGAVTEGSKDLAFILDGTHWSVEHFLDVTESTDREIDLDGDLVPDVTLVFRITDDYLDDGNGLYTYEALTNFVPTPAAGLLRDERGVDYASDLTTTTKPVDSPMYLGVGLFVNDPANLDPGTFTFTASVLYGLDGADGTDVYTVVFDTTGASTPDGVGPWAPAMGVSGLLDDHVIRDSLAFTATALAGDLVTPLALSDLAVDVTVDQREAVNHDKHARLDFAGPLDVDEDGTTTDVGFPGTAALAVSNQCAALPVETWAGLSLSGSTPLLPPALDLRVSDFGVGDHNGNTQLDAATERTLELDAHIDHPPPLLQVTSGATDADVDGDGFPDGLDLDRDPGADGIADDRLPWQYVDVDHDGSILPDVDLRVATQTPGVAMSPMYAALDVTGLPNHTSIDRLGKPTAIDVDGNGVADDVNGDGVVDGRDLRTNDAVGSFGFCERDRSSAAIPPLCTTPAVAGGRAIVSYFDTIPDLLGDDRLPFERAPFSPPAADLTDTADDGHFVPAPLDTAVVQSTKELTGGTDIDAATVDIAGLEEVTWDLRQDTIIDVHTQGLGQFGADASRTDAQTGEVSRVWSVLADAPDDVSVVVDGKQETADADPLSATWSYAGARTAAAIAIDAAVPGQSHRTLSASAWIGTDTGTTDGLFPRATITADLVGPDQRIALDEPVPPCIPPGPFLPGPCLPVLDRTDGMALDVGFATRTDAQLAAGLMTEGRIRAVVDDHVAASWSLDTETVTDLALTTCAAPATCPVRDLDATVVTADSGGTPPGPLPHRALNGVAMIPVPDDDHREFPDFTAERPGDIAHAVFHDDARTFVANQPEPPTPVDERNVWGVDVTLGELSQIVYDRNTMSWNGPAYARTDTCVEGRGQGPTIDVGFYEDTGSESPATWFSGAIERENRLLDVGLQWNTPIDDDGTDGAIGDLDQDQQDFAAVDEDGTNLLSVDLAGCDDDIEDQVLPVVTGRLRRGTEANVGQVLALGSQSRATGGAGLPVPATDGLDAALYTTQIDPNAEVQALDAALRIAIPTSFEVRQPLLLQCGVGNQLVETCHDLPMYDTTLTSTVHFQTDSNWQTPLGDFDLELMTEPEDTAVTDEDGCTADRWLDECARRTSFHAARLPSALTLDATIQRRARDGFVDIDASLSDDRGGYLESLLFEHRDDYHPATLADGGSGAVTGQPIVSMALEDVGGSLDLQAEAWMPVYGWRGQAYNSLDCVDGWPRPGQIDKDHTFPNGDDPSGWKTLGPREAELLRQPYLHGSIDLDPDDDDVSATTARVEVDARVDEQGGYDGFRNPTVENWYDDAHRSAVKFGLDTAGEPTSGDLWGFQPGIQEHLHQTKGWGEFETCLDVDVPIHASWDDTSDLRVGIDLLKTTISVLEAEHKAGADVTVALEERVSADLGEHTPDTVTGLFAHEVKSWLHAPLGKDWASRVTDSGLSVGLLDPDDLQQEVPLHDAVSLQDDLGSGWSDSGLDGDRYYGSVIMQPLFAPDVEELMDDDNLVDSWAGTDGLWTTVDMTTDRITSWTLPVLDPDALTADSPIDFDTLKDCITVEKNATFQSYVPAAVTADGSTFELDVRWDNERVQLYLVGRYSNREVRFVRELFDADPGTKTCKVGLDGTIDTDPDTGRIQIDLELSATTKETPQPADWTRFLDETFVFDASGNGWLAGTSLEPSAAATTGVPTDLVDGRFALPGQTCIWYPGDGTWILPGDEDHHGASATHTYAMPGTYRSMQVCYETSFPGPDENQTDRHQGDLVERTVEVTDP